MKLLVLSLVLAASAVPKAAANDAQAPLQLRPKAALVAPAPHKDAPFVSPAPTPELDLAPRLERRRDDSRSSCAADNALCYDPQSGHIVYKPAREFMPDIPGMRRENISVKRDRIVFRYSF